MLPQSTHPEDSLFLLVLFERFEARRGLVDPPVRAIAEPSKTKLARAV